MRLMLLLAMLSRTRSYGLRTTCANAHMTVARRGVASMSGGGRASAAVTQSQKEDGGAQQQLSLQPPRGTRDFYPEEMALRNWLFGKMRSTVTIWLLVAARRI